MAWQTGKFWLNGGSKIRIAVVGDFDPAKSCQIISMKPEILSGFMYGELRWFDRGLAIDTMVTPRKISHLITVQDWSYAASCNFYIVGADLLKLGA